MTNNYETPTDTMEMIENDCNSVEARKYNKNGNKISNTNTPITNPLAFFMYAVQSPSYSSHHSGSIACACCLTNSHSAKLGGNLTAKSLDSLD